MFCYNVNKYNYVGYVAEKNIALSWRELKFCRTMVPGRQIILDFDETRDNVVAMALAGSNANHLLSETDN